MGSNELAGRKEVTVGEAIDLACTIADPNIVTSIFQQFGWTFNEEIMQVLKVARQDLNMPAKLNAIKMLREILKESVEHAGGIGDITHTSPDGRGGTVTFHAKGIEAALAPQARKQVDSKTVEESTDERREETGPYSGSTDSPAEPPGRESPCGGTDGPVPGSAVRGDCVRSASGGRDSDERPCDDAEYARTAGGSADGGGGDGGVRDADLPADSGENACVDHKAPTCEHRLYPGVTGNPAEPDE